MTSSPIIRANFNGLTSILIKDLFLKKLITKGIKNVAFEARSEHCSSFVGFVVKLRKNDFNLGGHVGEFKWLNVYRDLAVPGLWVRQIVLKNIIYL